MHPKPLLDLCIDHLVNATACYQRMCNDYEAIWRDVGHVWADLWYLPPCVPARATQLLHTHLLHTHFLHEHQENDIYEMTCPILTLLAVKIRKITIIPVVRQLPSLSSSAFFSVNGVFSGEYWLQELDFTGIDLIQDLSVLEVLLPLCPELSVLKLGGNTTPDVLLAAKACPLTILHISERLVWEPRIFEDVLIDIVLGSKIHNSGELLESVRRRKPLDLNPTWPHLTDFSSGFCRVKQDFILMILIVFKKLHSLASRVVDVHKAVRTFYELQTQVPNMHKLSLKTNSVYCHKDMIDIFSRVAPKLETLKLTALGSDISQVSNSFPFLRELHVDLKFFDPDVSPAEILAGIGLQLTVLRLQSSTCSYYEMPQRCISSLLQVCPRLQDLTLAFNRGIQCDHFGVQEMPCFENITSLVCKSGRFRQEPLKCLLKMFPKLQTLSIEGRVNNFESVLQHLTQFQDLRILKLLRLEKIAVESLCELPRMTSDRRSWELYVSPILVSRSDIKKLQNCGWTYIPISDITSL
ncbi:uncharacterized protein LOC121866424 [Homarus americanus]|uniref:Uncharacterized protein n=1 Tax=Homarus americanus TaxID=6706 RepID=A0A8J5K482_HOMAM|nr:uncharacterized protein LOC121866424 [Homarus americanus]KAG7168942.1 hypothetical protein Hamer_G011623 [Homarus americanus]